MNASVPEQQPLTTAANGGKPESDESAPPRAPFIDATEADRYALAFRPSWECLLPEATPDAAHEPGLTITGIPALTGIPGKRSWRATAMAVLSICGFCGLTYWGVHSSGVQEDHAAAPSPALGRAESSRETETAPLALKSSETAPTLQADLSGLVERVYEPTPTPRPRDGEQLAVAPIEPAPSGVSPQPLAPTLAPTDAEHERPTVARPEVARPVAAAEPAAIAVAVEATKAPNPRPTAAPQALPAARVRSPLLFVRTVPEGAHVWLDGRRMASPPFDVTLPRGTDHTLDVRSEGYEPSSQVLRVEADTKLTVTLKRAPTVQTPASAPTRRPLESHARRAGFVTSSPY